MGLDKFGRYSEDGSVGTAKGPTGEGFKLTPEGDYNMQHKRLKFVMDPTEGEDAVTLKVMHTSTIGQKDGAYDAGNKRIANVAQPESDSDVVTKVYMHSRVPASSSKTKYWSFKNKRLASVGDPIDASDVVTLQYLNRNVLIGTKDGWDFTSRRSINVSEPVADTDGVNKKYVDSAKPIRDDTKQSYSFHQYNIKDVAYPKEESDGVNAVFVKDYVSSVTPTDAGDHWSFKGKRISQVGDAVYDGEAVNLKTLLQTALCKKDEGFDAGSRRILNLGIGHLDRDAASIGVLKRQIRKHSEDVDRKLSNLGSALFNYIHKSSGRAAETGINSKNFLDWNTILKP